MLLGVCMGQPPFGCVGEFLPQRSPHGRPRCGSGRLGAAAATAPAAGFSASAPGLSCIWAPSGTLPLQATGLGTKPAEEPQDWSDPSADWDDWKEKVGGGERREVGKLKREKKLIKL